MRIKEQETRLTLQEHDDDDDDDDDESMVASSKRTRSTSIYLISLKVF